MRKTIDDNGQEYNFHIVEQTEFVDDATFQPFKVGKMETYLKRSTATKVFSAEKLMYICKNQLGIEKEYEQKIMPEGRLNIDGFLILFDVSPVPNRNIERQIEYVHNAITLINKNKKPIVLVTTKNDDCNELYVREAEKICQRKEYKGLIQLVETSAHESINTDLPFLILAQMIDKVKNRLKIIPYIEAAKSRKELLENRSEAVTRLIRNQIIDYHILWSQGSKILAQFREWNDFLCTFGMDAGQKLFRRHMKRLRDDHHNKKLHQYLEKFMHTLEYLLPDINVLKLTSANNHHRDDDDDDDGGGGNGGIGGGGGFDDIWDATKSYIRNHLEFDQYFFECPQASWQELIDMDETENETRIPYDVLDTTEAETVFRNFLNTVQQDKKKIG